MVHGLEVLRHMNDMAQYRATGSKTGQGHIGDVGREQWVLAMQISALVMAVNAPFCDGGPAEKQEWLDPIAGLVAGCTSQMAIQDTIKILEMSLERMQNRSEHDREVI